MRVIRLLLLGMLVYVGTIAWLFPAAPVAERFAPMLQPLVLNNVSGSLLNGAVGEVSYDDGVIPLNLSNVSWRLVAQKLFTGAAGVSFSFDAYGGGGNGVAAQRWNGDLDLTDFDFSGPAKGLEALLPLPIAAFSGQLDAGIELLEIRDQLLKTVRGTVDWKQALLEQPVRANLGDIALDIKPVDENSHRGFLVAKGGDLSIDGTVDLALNGDYRTDITITPASSASPELLNSLRSLARPDPAGRFRIRQNGNVNRLM